MENRHPSHSVAHYDARIQMTPIPDTRPERREAHSFFRNA